MSLLQQLEYFGIRSVPSQDRHIIDFETPLTLISGPNGSGKTTLIEALKFITAGEAPPGDKIAFVHNLQLARVSRVDAAVQLKFLTEKKQTVVVKSRFYVAAAKTKRGVQFKSDESTIHITDEYGKVRSSSSKNLDTKSEVLNLLGVPAAILSNVIFCHQEDSCWPLSEPTELKKRFDKIFQLQKFTKAIEQAKKIRKEQAAQLKVWESTKNHHELLLRNKGKAMREENEAMENLKEYTERLEELTARINEDTEQSRKMEAELNNFKTKREKKDIINANLSVYYENVQRMRNQGVKEFQGTWKELEAAKEQACRQVDNEEQRRSAYNLEQVEREVEQKRMEKESCQHQLNELIRRQENYMQEMNNLETMEAEVRGKFCFLDGDDEITVAIPKASKQRKQLLEEAITMHNGYRLDSQKKVEECLETLSTARAELRSLQDQKTKLVREIDELETKISSIEGGGKREINITKRLQELELMSQGLPSVNENQNREIQMKKVHLREEIDSLRQEMLSASAYEEQAKEADRLTTSMGEAKEKYDLLLAKHRDSMTVLFNRLPDGHWGETVRTKKREIDAQMENLTETLNTTNSNFRNETKNYEDKSSEEERFAKQIEKMKEAIENKCGCEIGQLRNGHAKIEQELKKTRKELAPLNTKSNLYEEWINETTSTSCCPLCERKFLEKDSAQSFVQKLNNMTLSLPDDITRLTEKLSELEVKEKTLAEGLNDTKRLDDLEASLEQCRKQKEHARKQKHEHESQLKKTTTEHKHVKEISERLNIIMADVSLLDDHYTTYKHLESKFQALPILGAAMRSTESIRMEISKTEAVVKELESKIEKIDRVKEKRNEIESEALDLRKELVQMSETSAQKSSLEEQLVNKRGEVNSIEVMLQKQQALLPQMEADHREKQKKQEEATADFNKRENIGWNELNQLDAYLKQLTAQKSKIGQLFVPDFQVDEQKKQLRELESDYNELLMRKGTAENNNGRFAQLMEQKKYIDRQIDLFELNKKISDLETNLKSLNIPDDNHIATLNENYSKKKNKISQNLLKKSKLEGQMSEIEKKLKEARACLGREDMKKAELTFRNTLIDRAICEKIIKDLDSFVAVLDSSILKFHKDKMTAINIILDDLWRKVYNGVDIETIRIKTEKNESEDKRASYDYNVMMVLEGGIEVGMRDRCSAGQKMLASLLIRIALADVFAKTCSIIALDEPTTNLDTSKIEQMASMLNTLINTRRADDEHGNVQGKQFQMIVITHDDRLVSALKLGCRPDKTFRLSKDPMSGKPRLDAYDSAGNKVPPSKSY